jgi:signal peptidase I
MKTDAEKLLKNLPVELIVILLTLAAYIISLSIFVPEDPEESSLIPIILAGLVFIEILFFVGAEVKEGVEKKGWKHEATDTLLAIAIAVMVWFGLGFLLNTGTPISGVASCSMLPNLDRGDFIIVQGSEPEAYEISMSQEELDALAGPFYIEYGGNTYTSDEPVYTYCQCHTQEAVCIAFRNNPGSFTEVAGPFAYHYAECDVEYKSGVKGKGPCLEYVEFKGSRYYQNLSNDVIVYIPQKGDYYGGVGDIVHRAFFKINVDGKRYYLTKGDNNPVMDHQNYYCPRPDVRNSPIPEENLRGKVIFRIPYLGYLKLFVMGLWEEDEQCRWLLSYETVD